MYYKYKEYANSTIEVVPIELKGRGTRISEPFSERMEDVVDDIINFIRSDIIYCEYLIFGHSMGSIILFELVKKLQIYNYPLPLHVFFSGCLPPKYINNLPKIYNAPLGVFKSEILKLGGTPKEVFDNKTLSNIFVPIMRADYKLIETYVYEEILEKLHCNASIFYGSNDDMTTEVFLFEWGKYIDGKIDYYCFEGNHFYVNESAFHVMQTINQIICERILI